MCKHARWSHRRLTAAAILTAAGLAALWILTASAADAPLGWHKVGGVVEMPACGLRSMNPELEAPNELVWWIDCSATAGVELSAIVSDADSSLEGRAYISGNLPAGAIKLANLWAGNVQPSGSTAELPIGAAILQPGEHKFKMTQWGDGYTVQLLRLVADSMPLPNVYIEIRDEAGQAVIGARTNAAGEWSAWLPTGFIGTAWAIGQIQEATHPAEVPL